MFRNMGGNGRAKDEGNLMKKEQNTGKRKRRVTQNIPQSSGCKQGSEIMRKYENCNYIEILSS